MITREELRDLGFSEEAINDKLGEEPRKFDREHIVHVWKVCSNRKELTKPQHDLLIEMCKEYEKFGDTQLPKLKYKIKG